MAKAPSKAARKSKEMDEAYEVLQMDPKEFIRRVGRRDPVVFAEDNLTNEKREPITLSGQHNFQVQYMRDFAPDLRVKKASQVGMTTTSVGKVLYLSNLDTPEDFQRFGVYGVRGMTIIYTFPTGSDVNEFSKTRFKPMIQSSQYLRELLKETKDVDAVEIRRIKNTNIHFRGTYTTRQGISVPADLIINDELDFSNMEVVDAFNSRISKSQFQWRWKFSTPTIPNYGIDAEYNESNQYRWTVKCPRCSFRQQIKWPENVKRKKVKGVRLAYFGCRRCGRELPREDGTWVAKFPDIEKHGYFIPPTICPWIQPLTIVNMRKEYRTEKQFTNFALGEAYSSGQDVLTRELLLKRIEFGDPFNPELDRMTYMGVDQGDLLHWVVNRGRYGRRELIDYGVCTTFAEIAMIMRKYNIKLCVMDMLPNKKPAQELAEEFYGRIMLSIYKQFDDDGDIRESKNVEFGLLSDRTNTLDSVTESWINGESVIVLNKYEVSRVPETLDDPTGKTAFIQQMGNMNRDEVENAKTGKSRGEWVKTGPEHFRHADNYAYIAWLTHQGARTDFDSESNVASNQVMAATMEDLRRMERQMETSGFSSRY